MEKSRKQLLWSAIIIFIYTLIVYSYIYSKNELFTSNKFNNYTNIFQLVISILGGIYFIILSFSNKINLNKHKIPILILSIIYFAINIISGVLGFIVYGNLKDKKKEKRELPKLEDVDDYNKYIYLAVLILCLFLLFFVSNYLKGIFVWFIYIAIFVIMVFSFRKRLKRDFSEFKEYFKEYSLLVLKTWGKSLICLLIISLLIRQITGLDNATNQKNLNELFNSKPLLVALLAMIYAPISEELMFRGVFKKFLKGKYSFILISGFTFGLIHVIDDFQSYAEFLYVFVYGCLGCFLASLYYKTNNIFTNISFHFLQNTLSVVLMLLLYLTK